MKTIGILSIQGDYEKHAFAVENLGYKTVNVKTPEEIDLIDDVRPIRVMDQSAWGLEYKIKRPGVYTFYTEKLGDGPENYFGYRAWA